MAMRANEDNKIDSRFAENDTHINLNETLHEKYLSPEENFLDSTKIKNTND